MTTQKRLGCLLLALAVSLFLIAGCVVSPSGTTDSPPPEAPDTVTSVSPSPEIEDENNSTDDAPSDSDKFSYSGGFDENGYWVGVKALDCIELFNYKSMKIPSDIHLVSDETLQGEISTMLSEHATTTQVTNRAIIQGDTVNIDYVGSIDGEEFANGSTDGMGTEVTIGVTEYIDDFLEQLVGHKPGTTVNVEVTFPDDYGETSLQGKDALFVTTINYIVDTEIPELTDDFVATNLAASFGWTTIEEMKAGISSNIQLYSIQQYIQQYFTTDVTVLSMPETLIKYQENAFLDSYRYYADYYGVEFEEFIAYEGYSSADELIEANHEYNMAGATYNLVAQAVAEDAGLTVTDDDLTNFFLEMEGVGDYSSYVEQFGLPYLKHYVLNQMVINYIVDNADLV